MPRGRSDRCTLGFGPAGAPRSGWSGVGWERVGGNGLPRGRGGRSGVPSSGRSVPLPPVPLEWGTHGSSGSGPLGSPFASPHPASLGPCLTPTGRRPWSVPAPARCRGLLPGPVFPGMLFPSPAPRSEVSGLGCPAWPDGRLLSLPAAPRAPLLLAAAPVRLLLPKPASPLRGLHVAPELPAWHRGWGATAPGLPFCCSSSPSPAGSVAAGPSAASVSPSGSHLGSTPGASPAESQCPRAAEARHPGVSSSSLAVNQHCPLPDPTPGWDLGWAWEPPAAPLGVVLTAG